MSKIKLILSMTLFGTIGVFVRYIPFPSSFIALIRGMIGALFLLAVVFLSGKKMSWPAVKKNFGLLFLSGAAIGINWILLFEAYRYTTVATATLCYYLAPVFVILLSPVILKERLTVQKLLCAAAALTGMVLISGIWNGQAGAGNVRGLLCGIGAAVFYAAVVLMNQFLRDISSLDSTITQLSAAAIVLLPYTLVTESVASLTWSLPVFLLLMIVGIVHTGIGYCMYFSSMPDLSSQTIAIFSYIDPAVAIFLSAFFLHEPLDRFGVFGAILILGSTFLSEIKINLKKG